MSKSQGSQAVFLVLAASSLFAFFRTPGADAVRGVQILLLFVAGMCAGVALTWILKDRRS